MNEISEIAAPPSSIDVMVVVSMLHEGPVRNSATRRFRREPVLSWTLRRLACATRLSAAAVICWNDQINDVEPIAEEHRVFVLTKTPRVTLPPVEAVAAAQRWADGWRGGLLSTCDFDRGFYAPWVQEAIERGGCETALIVDAAAALVDPTLIDALIIHAESKPEQEIVFSQAAPGFGGVLIRPSLLRGLAQIKSHPGRVLHYMPNQPMRDPIGGDACVPVAMPVARTTRRFKMDSDRQIERLTDASVSLNGELFNSESEEIVHRLAWSKHVDPLPREVTLELTTHRATSPIFWPGTHIKIDRPAMTVETAKSIIDQISAADDVRLSLAGVGDPLLHPQLIEIIKHARQCGIEAIHLETDLLPQIPEVLHQLVEHSVDIVSFHLPAMSQKIYEAMMGADRFSQVLSNVGTLARTRHERGRGVPLLAPLFVKTAINLHEMETWYDQWLNANGSAVVVGPSDYCGQIPDVAVADMSPQRRFACSRLQSRMTILSDGRVVSCEQDVLGNNAIGNISEQPISTIWRDGFTPLRESHARKEWNSNALCAGCKEWHRP